MKNIFIFLIFLVSTTIIFAQSEPVDKFDEEPSDSTYWFFNTSEHASADAYLNLDYIDDPVQEGKAMKISYGVQDAESWGGFYKIEHWNPDSNAYFDYSDFENLTVWYYNAVPQDSTERVHMRIQLLDASDSPNGVNTYDIVDTEIYYSFHYVLDDAPGWNQIVINMARSDSYAGEAFTLTTWNGIQGNGKLDLDKIKGWAIEFSVSGAGSGDIVKGEIILDELQVQDPREKPMLIFNGKTVNTNFGMFTWGQSALQLIEGGGMDPATNSLEWTMGDEWANGFTGAGWNIDPAVNIRYRWDLDSLKFNMKCEPATGDLLMQFESAEGKRAYTFTPTADNDWHEYALPLRDFVVADGAVNFDSSAITVFQFMTPGTAVAGTKVWFDYIWTGDPEIDVIPPLPPEGLSASADQYVNIISWIDVAGEDGETYSVYYSENPITDLEAPGVETVQINITEGEQSAEHVLIAPKTNQNVTYYYAITCTDAAGNISDIAQSASSVTNEAKGVATIEPTAPPSFAADGNLSEWTGIMPFRMYPSDGSGTVVTNTTIDSDADLSADIYLAIDDDYLYFAWDVEDDVISNDTTFDSYLVDSPDLYIGFYNWHGNPHTSYQRGLYPDYHFRFGFNRILIDNLSGHTLAYNGGEDYYWGENFPSGYIVEGRMSLDAIAAAGSDNRFIPSEGIRVPIDFSINDNDTPGTDEREGILTYSPNNEDQSYQDVSRWVHTWIGDEWVTGVEPEDTDPGEIITYSLDQNYPNPFNPATQIKYSIEEAGIVTLKVYNILGEEVVTLVNMEQPAGKYIATFNASRLASGIYIYQIQAGSFISSKKMMLLK